MLWRASIAEPGNVSCHRHWLLVGRYLERGEVVEGR